MKRNLVNFTRGSQLLGHFSFMFAAGLKGPLIIAAVVFAWATWWALSAGLSQFESYLVWMRLYAAVYAFMEFDPHKEIAVKTVFGGSIKFPIGLLENFPPVVRAWAHMLGLLKGALLRSAALLGPAFALFYWFAARFGRKSKERKHERGALLAALAELIREVHAHNLAERAKELGQLLGWRWRLCSRTELEQVLPYCPSAIAKVTYPWRLEQSHAMLIGTTGMGKTVALSDMIEEARSKGQRAVIFDLTGTFIEHFYEPGRDVILNPLDARCPQWSVFDECRDEAEFTAVAEALVPHDGGGAEQFWVLAARLLFVEMCLKLSARGQASNDALATELMTADLAAVHRLMRGTIADPLTAPEAARMAESIRAVFNANAKALMLLPRAGPRFSLRQWVEADRPDGSIVFISARYVDMSVCSQLLTVWLDLAMNTLMSLERTRELRLWIFIDEMGALHRLPALEKGLQTARNYGGAIVTGIHAYAKLKEVYGDNMAMTLSSLARTKLILGTADRETATWCSDFIGHTQVRDMEEGYTYGYNNARDAVSLTSRKHIEPLLLPDQLMNLPRLSGYLKFPDGFPAAPVKLRPVTRPRRAEPFIRRASKAAASAENRGPPAPPRPRLPEGTAATGGLPASNDDGAGQRVVPKQGELVLQRADPGSNQGVGADPRTPADELFAGNHHTTAMDNRAPPAQGVQGPIDRRDISPFDSGVTRALPAAAAVRAGANDAQAAAKSETPQSDALPSSSRQPVRQQAGQNGARGSGAQARSLMVEDGLPDPLHPARAVPGLGDVDMDI